MSKADRVQLVVDLIGEMVQRVMVSCDGDTTMKMRPMTTREVAEEIVTMLDAADALDTDRSTT